MLCCVRFNETFPKDDELQNAESSSSKHGFIYYIFCCCLMPKWCWASLGGKDTPVAVNLDEDREDEDGDLIDENEEKDEDGEDEGGED